MKYTREDIGCYFDGAFGFEYNAKRIIDFAIEHGFTPHYQTDINGDHLDALAWEAGDAEKYLNDNTTRPENTHWSWENGDFGLWQYNEDGELV